MSDAPPPSLPISLTDLNQCQAILSKLHTSTDDSFFDSEAFLPLRSLLHNLVRLDRRRKRKRLTDRRNKTRSTDRSSKNQCLLRVGRAQTLHQLAAENLLVPDGPSLRTLSSSSPSLLIAPQMCYICKLRYRTLHFFYDRLCPACAKLNFDKRNQSADLSNRVALVTGGRVKIGFRVVLKLLRAKCFVIVTTRFPVDCLNRLKTESDFADFQDRIHVYGIDFRYSKLVEQFATLIVEKYPRLDFLINNACQTIQRSSDFYQHLFEHERLANYSLLPGEHRAIVDGNRQFYTQFYPSSTALALPPTATSLSLSPSTLLDVHQQPIDFSLTNSWRLRLADLSSQEMNDVLTINTLAPFILNSRLKILMSDKHPEAAALKFIVNVSAMEGSFSRRKKTDRHPHTNAAKAALNMMTRTSASDYKKSNIFMVSVDTGWINEENPLVQAQKKFVEYDFQTPLDEEDAAARILDPIFSTFNRLAEGQTNVDVPFGCFLKDYQRCDW